MKLFRCIAAAFVSGIFSNLVQAHSTKRNPLSYLSVIDDPVIRTPSHRVHAYSSFDLTFHLHGRKQFIKLTLAPNEDVIAEGATINYIGADGKVRDVELIERTDYKIFRGQAWVRTHEDTQWTSAGWARVIMHQDGVNPIFEGAFRINGDHHHIHPKNTYVSTKHELDPDLEDDREDIMVVWRDSDIAKDESRAELKRSVHTKSCLSDNLSFNMRPDHPVYSTPILKIAESSWGYASAKSIFGRDVPSEMPGNGAGVNLLSSIGSTAGCPTTRRVALVGIATDCTYTGSFNSTATVRAHIINQMNSASVLYEDSFNISLGIQNLTISDANCPATASSSTPWNVGCDAGPQIQDRLNLFSAWRGERQDTNAYWTLLTTCRTGSAVGLAWLGQACINTAQPSKADDGTTDTVSGANVVVKTSTEWLVIAHEVGHTFGAVHDCDANTCADEEFVAAQRCCPFQADTCVSGGNFIMNPSTGEDITNFSPCSIGNICGAMRSGSVKSHCLTSNRNVPTITGSQCGNGIVEAGEECDCGGVSGCSDNPCCEPTTCKFKGAAVCDPSNEDCCLGNCSFASNGTICRESTGFCDPGETCSGTEATCPENSYSPDGDSCGDPDEDLACASGQCTSRTLQCKSIMGVFTTKTVMGVKTTTNNTYACSNDGCQLSCASPEFKHDCYTMQQNFLDGTKCRGGGKCSNGMCKGTNFQGLFMDFYKENPALTIGIIAGVGGLILIAILSCCISSCRRRSRRRKAEARSPPTMTGGSGWMQQGSARGYAPVPVPPVVPHRAFGGGPPTGQMPAYSYGAGGQQYDDRNWNAPPPAYGGAPMRYA